ncbi:hypothetical protein [Nesterenkonia sphaerica]|uniref:Uncharacterized protein n=1 Tax=Nesterenkonia sphaerica TaxID=1804988 RepID=A0A5R9AQ48_9MICC|nr:hypothetical protein [Nesterenkonia sphaerica]TLP79976.1 hypothetical protein FEF27_00900 [Nesterenkonia sphaerica]
MNRIERLYSDLSRLGRETEMMDTVITMLADDLMEATAASGHSRQDVIRRVVEGGYDMAALISSALGLPQALTSSMPNAGGDLRLEFRRSHVAFTAAAAHLTALPEEAALHYRGLTLTPGEVVPQRIAEIVLTHDSLGTAWSMEEADPDSALDALEALMRRMAQRSEIPPLRIDTVEGETWELGDQGQRVFGDREALVQWLAWGETGDLESDAPLPSLPTLPQWS